MGLRIQTNVPALKSQRNLATSGAKLSQSMERLSSGYRINKASDDAAGLAISESLNAKLRSMVQAKRNANDGVSLIQVAEGSISEVSNILMRLRELSVQAASDTISGRERSFANTEYNELVAEIDRISNVTEFNGIMLLQGGSEDQEGPLAVHVGVGNASMPNRDVIEIDLEHMQMRAGEHLGLVKGEAIGPEDSEDLGFSREAASEKLSIIDKALNHVSEIRANLGAKQSRLSSTINNLSVAQENVSASNSRIRDVDFAAETAAYTQARILQQGGVQVQSQANTLPEMALALLR